MRRIRQAWLFGIGLLVSVAGTPLPAGELIVSVAVSLQAAVDDVVALHHERFPGVEIAVGTGASSVLMQQILRGAPVDIYLSASPGELDRLEREGRLADGTRCNVASNRLVVFTARDAAPPRALDELAGEAFDRVAVGNPETSPVGRYTRQALAALGLAESLGERLILGESAREVVTWVARGEVSAGLGYRTDALRFADRVRRGPEFPVDAHEPIVYQAAVIAGSDAGAQARRFLDLLLSPEGRAILDRHGFLPPP